MMKKVCIIQVVQHLQPGGLESLVIDINKFSTSNSLIISLEGTKNQAIANWPSLKKIQDKLYFFDKKPGVQMPLFLSLQRFFKQTQPDAIHTHHIGPLLYAGVAARAAKVPTLIHTEHDAWHLQNKKRRSLQAAMLKLVKPHLVADAKSVAKSLQHFFPSQKITTIVNGIDTKRFVTKDKKIQRKNLNLPLCAILIGSAGRLEQVKGHDLLISAMALLPKTVHLAIAGNGSQAQALQALAQQLKISERVHFLGHLEKTENFYPALDIFCLPSRNEGYPLSALEAQACGIPTAVTHVGSAKETLCKKTGVLLSPNNIPCMAASLHAMVHDLDPSLSPREFICTKNDIRQMISCYEQLVKSSSVA